MHSQSSWRISLQAWISLFLLALVIYLTIQFASLLLEIGGVLFGAFLLSLAIRPLSDTLRRWHIPRWITVILVYIGIGGILALLGFLLVPVVGNEINRLQTYSPALAGNLVARVEAIPFLGNMLPSPDTLTTNVAQRLTMIATTLVHALTSVGSLALDLLIVIILTFFFTLDPGLGKNLIAGYLPQDTLDHYQPVMENLRRRLGAWVWAQLAIAVYFSLVFSIGIELLGVPFAFTIGLVGGVLEIIPYLGGVVALGLAILSALTVYPLLALWVIIYYLVVIEIESHFVAPALYGRITGIHPATVLIALLAGAKLGGILGLLFAIPITLVLVTINDELQNLVNRPPDKSES